MKFNSTLPMNRQLINLQLPCAFLRAGAAVTTLFALVLFCLPGTVRAQFEMGGPTNSLSITTIKADGSCETRNESISSRAALELMVKMMSRYVGGEIDSDEPPPQPKPADAKPLSDDELVSRIRDLEDNELRGLQSDNPAKVEVSFPSKETIKVTKSRQFAYHFNDRNLIRASR